MCLPEPSVSLKGDHERTGSSSPGERVGQKRVGQTGTSIMNTELRITRVFVELADTLVDEFDALDFSTR